MKFYFAMNESDRNILSSGETEIYVQNLEPTKIENLGTLPWFESHHRFQKLSQQSTIEAGEMREECVKDFIISYGKIPVLVHEIICIQVWREKVFCHIIKLKHQPQNTFLVYVILFHEITVLSLLQNILYHRTSLEGVGDVAVDLIDYCASEIVRLLSEDYAKLQEESAINMTNMEEIKSQSKTIGFNIGLSAICILRYLIEYMDELSLSAIARFFKTHDIPILITNLIQMAPWKRINFKTNMVQIYEDRSWKNIDKMQGISKYEGQCWIALRFLLLNMNIKYQYELTEFRKQHLIKLSFSALAVFSSYYYLIQLLEPARLSNCGTGTNYITHIVRHKDFFKFTPLMVQKYLTESVLDQIPPLMELNRYLVQLSVTNIPTQKKQPLIMETIPEVKSGILNQCMNKWKKIAGKQIEMIFTAKKDIMMEVARRLGETYDLDHLERLAPEGPVCSNCGDAAAKRCSKCKNEWYCGRECQVKRWPKHKMVCHIMTKQNDCG